MWSRGPKPFALAGVVHRSLHMAREAVTKKKRKKNFKYSVKKLQKKMTFSYSISITVS
jgi:hypothetical protein